MFGYLRQHLLPPGDVARTARILVVVAIAIVIGVHASFETQPPVEAVSAEQRISIAGAEFDDGTGNSGLGLFLLDGLAEKPLIARNGARREGIPIPVCRGPPRGRGLVFVAGPIIEIGGVAPKKAADASANGTPGKTWE